MKQLPVNLATHPIEHRRWARRVTAIAAVAVFVVSAAHALLAWSLVETAPPPEPDTEVIELLRRWSTEVAEMAEVADSRAARDLAIAVEMANDLAEQRAFRWGELFGTLEETLPDDVRLETIQPVATVDGVRVSLTATSRSSDSLRRFLSALEARPEFAAVFPGRQVLGIDGELRLSLEATATTP